MVVIVIIGILAAIAIPKLFGMSAKAKASEVGPAAGTWSKLTAAYLLEKDSTGTFEQISYTPPGTPDGSTPREKSSTGAFTYESTGSTSEEGKWKATNTTKLNNCVENTGFWEANQLRTDPEPKATAPITGCVVLTPNFTTLR
jgi:type II secretory pathway pseudopilin PulG